MPQPFTDCIALITLMLWPAVPLFWIPVHCLPGLFRRLGLATYLLPLVTWLPSAIMIYDQRAFLLGYMVEMPLAVKVAGFVLLVPGVALQTWTILLLTGPGIMGMPEVTDRVEGRMVTRGPFALVRHPTYLSHTMMLVGVFFLTGRTAVLIISLIDALVINIIVIPLEERELAKRFGVEYEEYRKRVPARFLPGKRRR